MKNEIEELKNLLKALEKKLGNLAGYENQLINESEALKTMYFNLMTSILKNNETYEKFYQYTKCILERAIDEKVEKALEDIRKKRKYGFLWEIFE